MITLTMELLSVLNIQKRYSFYFMIFCAAPVLMIMVFFVFPTGKTVWAKECISLEEAVALAGEKDEAVQESRQAYRIRQVAWLEASKQSSAAALQPEKDLPPGEILEKALAQHIAALEYIKAAELLFAEELRLEYEVEECYLAAMLAQQKRIAADERLGGREKRYAEIDKKYNFGIAGEEEIAAAEEACKQAREELLQATEEYNVSMAALGEKIGLPLDGNWSVQTGLLYEHVTMDEFGDLTELALAADRDVNFSVLDARFARLKEKQAFAFAAEYLSDVDYAILESTSLTDGDEAAAEGLWRSWLWLKDLEGENFTFFEDAQVSLLQLRYAAQFAEKKIVEQGLIVPTRVRQALAESVELQQPLNEADLTFAQRCDSYEKILLQYNFGVASIEKVVSQEDALAGARLSRLEAVFNGQAALSRLNYATNGGLKKYQGQDGQIDTTLKEATAFFFTPLEPVYPADDGFTSPAALFRQGEARLKEAYEAALKEDEKEIASGVKQLLDGIQAKLRQFVLLELVSGLIPDEEAGVTESLILLEREKYSQEELAALQETGEQLRKMIGGLQVIPADHLLSPLHAFKFAVPPVLFQGRMYVTADFIAELLGGLFTVLGEEEEEGSPLLIFISHDSFFVLEKGGKASNTGDAEGQPAFLQAGEYLLLPLRPLAEKYGLKVQWYGERGLTLIAN